MKVRQGTWKWKLVHIYSKEKKLCWLVAELELSPLHEVHLPIKYCNECALFKSQFPSFSYVTQHKLKHFYLTGRKHVFFHHLDSYLEKSTKKYCQRLFVTVNRRQKNPGINCEKGNSVFISIVFHRRFSEMLTIYKLLNTTKLM